MKNKKFTDKGIMRKRMNIVMLFIAVLFFLLIGRLAYIMIIKAPEYSAKAVEQWTSEISIAAKRGKILDTNGVELAVSANVYRIDFDLNAIRNYLDEKYKDKHKFEAISKQIADASGIDEETVLKKLRYKLPSGREAGSSTLVRRIEKEQADKVKDLNIKGVIVSADTKRYYPNNNFLAHVIGTTNVDGRGLGGIELQYNKELSGVPGVRIAELNGYKNSELPYTVSSFTDPVDGSNVTLTIDEKMQEFAEQAAQIALDNNKAKSASVMIMSVKTGEILAMTNKPDFNPNTPYEGADKFDGKTASDKVQKMWRNHLVSDAFECGSIFKVITASAGVELGVANKGETYSCNGATNVLGTTIHCWKHGGHGTQTFPEILQNSCNVGFIQLGKAIGKEKLNKYIEDFGFGKKSGIDLPGEAKGIVKATDKITDVDLATIAFGQTDAVNPTQYMAAFCAIGNNGVWTQPHIMKEISHIDSDGNKVIDKTFEPKTKRVVSESTAKQIRQALELVVTKGSAKQAQVEGYRIGGKTGTAEKVNPETGRYFENKKYISSFAAMAPIDDPEIAIFITIDEPSTGVYYAGQIATPIGHILFSQIFNYLGTKIKHDDYASLKKTIIIPDVRGMKVEEGKKKLKDLNLDVNITGDGDYITNLSPLPGYAVKEGTKIDVALGGSSNYNKDVVVPDVTGYTKPQAQQVFNSVGLTAEFKGSGLVGETSVQAGDTVKKGSKVVCTLEMDDDLGD